MSYTIILGRQRSGSNVLRMMLSDAFDLTEHGEILDPGWANPVKDPELRQATWPRLVAFLEQLHADNACHLVDIKINLLRQLSPPFRSPMLRPALLEMAARHGAKVIRLHRSPVEQWISASLAKELGYFHLRLGAEVKRPQVTINPIELQNFITSCALEDQAIADWTKDLRVLDLHYEAEFAPGREEFSGLFAKIAEATALPLREGWQQVRPRLQKQAHSNLAMNVANFDQIAHVLPFQTRVKLKPDEQLALPAIDQFEPAFQDRLRGRQKDMDLLLSSGLIEPKMIIGKTVLDWECGDGAFAYAIAAIGASQVFAHDSWLNIEKLPLALRAAAGFHFQRAGITEIASQLAGKVDFILANTVTEHLPDLPAAFKAAFDILAPNGVLFINHDNYYQPIGSHDHGLLTREKGHVVAKGPKCWQMIRKCRASESFRAEVAKQLPWTWDARNDRGLTPDDCTQCPYFKRSQPWAHLIYQQEFRTLFPQEQFTTGKPKSSLNKVTPFQLRQFIIEAGFDIVGEQRATILNTPPPMLVSGNSALSKLDLTTAMLRIAAVKPA